MNLQTRRKIVLLGMMTKIPVAGHVWLVAQYLIGLRRLGFDPYYVEAHGITPTVLMETPDDDGSALAAACIEKFMRRFDMQDRWAYHALHDGGRHFGMTELTALKDLYRNAELIINLHGCTVPLPEHCSDYSVVGGRLVYLETDPVELEIEIYNNQAATIEFCLQHNIFFTWGLNYYQSDCRVPMPSQFSFLPTFPIVISDWWQGGGFRASCPRLEATGLREDTAASPRWLEPQASSLKPQAAFTTVGNWEQKWHDVQFQGETYHWSKHYEYQKFIDLPQRTSQPLELALARYSDDDLKMLEANGWRVRSAEALSSDLDLYRDYVQKSRGEFTVAKDQNVRLRSGWFSERSAQYLAAGRPVITQDTGFGSVLPTGRGLFSFTTMEDILAAIDTINTNYPLHCRAADEIAHEYFNYDVVLGKLLAACGVKVSGTLRVPQASDGTRSVPDTMMLPPTLDLRTVSRWPTTLSAATVETIQSLPVPWADGRLPTAWHKEGLRLVATGLRRDTAASPRLPAPQVSRLTPHASTPTASIVIPTYNNLLFTRLCIESLLPHTTEVDYELILVDNNSTDGTREYLSGLAEAANGAEGGRQSAVGSNQIADASLPAAYCLPPTVPRVRLIFNEQNVGFARACNQGLSAACGESLVLLNNDTVLPPRWLSRLLAWLKDKGVGLVGPVTNRSGNEAQIPVTYRTVAEYLDFSAALGLRLEATGLREDRAASPSSREPQASSLLRDIRTATMFCVAMRRDVYDMVGPLDEQYELALFEDDDYSMRVRQRGLAVKCADDVFVHHFGQASVGQLDARYGELFHANRRRWEAKWNMAWQPYAVRASADYQGLVARIAETAGRIIPPGSRTLVISKGDDALLAGIGRHAQHFPQDRCNRYAGYNPKDSTDAIDHLERLRADGALFLLLPSAYFWWLDHYSAFARHLRNGFRVVHESDNDCLIFLLALNTMG